MKNLGKEGRDKVTEFEGIIVGKIEYRFGCAQYGLAPKAKDGDVKETRWFDEGRIEIIGNGIQPEEVMAERNGGVNSDCPKGVY